MSMAWYVVQVATNMEDKVQANLISTIIKRIMGAKELGQTQKVEELMNAFNIDPNLINEIELKEFLEHNSIMVPKEKIEEIRNGKKLETERKIYPSYVLIKMDYTDDVGLMIKKTPKVSGFVGVAKDSKPVPIPATEVEIIFQQINESKEKIKHRVEFEIGERIRITNGPFIDFNALIEEVMYNKSRLRVNVQIFGRETSVELDFAQVEKT